MGTISPKNTGTITGGVGTTTLTVTFTTAPTDNEYVGRVIYLTDGGGSNPEGQGRYRRITANTTTTVTIDAAFGTSVFRSLTSETSDADGYDATNERPETTSSQFSISTDATELGADDDIAVDGHTYTTTGTVTLSAGTVVYLEDVSFTYDYQDHLRITKGAALICGRQNFGDLTDDTILGYPSNSCCLVDTSTGFIDGGLSDRGAFHVNGGSWRGSETADAGTFYRFNADASQSFRFWNVNITGKFGGRVSGFMSAVFGNTVAGNTSTLGMLNPLTMSIFSDNTVLGSTQAVYMFPSASGDTTVGAMDVQDIDTQVIRMNLDVITTDTTQTLQNWDFTQINNLTANVIAAEQYEGSGTHTVRFRKDYDLSFTNADGTAVTESGSYNLEDVGGTLQHTGLTTFDNGVVPTENLIAYETAITADGNTAALSDFTASTPYTWAVKYRRHNLLSGTTDLDGPTGPFEATFPRLEDINVTATDAEVDAYTEIETAEELYNYADKFKHDNITLPTLTTQLLTRSGDLNTTTHADYDVRFDSTATTIMEVIDFGGAQHRATVHFELGTPNVGSLLIDVTNPDGADVDITLPLVGGLTATEVATMVRDAINNDSVAPTFVTATSTGNTVTLVWTELVDVPGNGVSVTGSLSEDVNPSINVTAEGAPHTDTIAVKSPTTGYTGGIAVSTGRMVTFDATIQGEVDATTINFHGTAPSTIIDTPEAISGTITLPVGTYTIRDANISNLTVNNTGGGTTTLDLVNTVGEPTLGENVGIQRSIDVIVTGGPAGGGNIHFFTETGTTSFSKHANVSEVNISNGIGATQAVRAALADGAVITVVFTAPGYTDVIETATITDGQVDVSIVTSEEGLPTGSEADTYDAVYTASYSTTDSLLTVSVTGAKATDTAMTTARTNHFINQVKDDDAYLQAVKDLNTTGILGSEGSNGYGEATKGSVVFTSGENADQQFSYVRPLGTSTDNLSVGTDVTATINGVETTLSFSVVIPSGAPDYDQGGVELAVANGLDSRLITRQNVGNASLGIPAQDIDGNFVSPDL